MMPLWKHCCSSQEGQPSLRRYRFFIPFLGLGAELQDYSSEISLAMIDKHVSLCRSTKSSPINGEVVGMHYNISIMICQKDQALTAVAVQPAGIWGRFHSCTCTLPRGAQNVLVSRLPCPSDLKTADEIRSRVTRRLAHHENRHSSITQQGRL